jgi:hypothetical protein
MKESPEQTADATAGVGTPPLSSTLKNTNYIDKITMECMMNKKHYKTYLEKTNPTRLKESRNLQNKIIKNSIHIENIFEELLETSKKSIKGQNGRYNNKIQHAFYEFVEHSLQYIENEWENEAEPTPEEMVQKELMRDYGEEEVEEKAYTKKGRYSRRTQETIQDHFLHHSTNQCADIDINTQTDTDTTIDSNTQTHTDTDTTIDLIDEGANINTDTVDELDTTCIIDTSIAPPIIKEKRKYSMNKNVRRLEAFPSNYFL